WRDRPPPAAPRAAGAARAASRLRRLDGTQEATDLQLQQLRALRQIAGRLQDVAGGTAGLLRRAGHLDHRLRDLARAGGRLRGIAADLVGRGALLLDRGGDRGRDLVDLLDRLADRVDGARRLRRVALNRGDLRGDVLGRARGLAGQVLDLARDHREALAG